MHLFKNELLCHCQRLAKSLERAVGIKTRVFRLCGQDFPALLCSKEKDCRKTKSCKMQFDTLVRCAYTLGGRLIFHTPCKKSMLIFPIVYENKPIGAFICTDQKSDTIFDDKAKTHPSKIHYATICAVEKSWHFSYLLSQMASSLCPGSSMGTGGDYFFRLQSKLFCGVERKNISELSAVFADTISDTMRLSRGSFTSSKAIAQTIFYMILSICSDFKISEKEVFGENLSFFFSITRAQYESDIENLQKTVFNRFLSAVFGKASNRLIAVKEAAAYVEHHFMEKITLFDVASKIYMSPHYLSKAFLKEMGINFNEFLIETRIKKAKILLASKDMSISEIAKITGFSDQSHFTKSFKKHTGFTPKAFQKNASR